MNIFFSCQRTGWFLLILFLFPTVLKSQSPLYEIQWNDTTNAKFAGSASAPFLIQTIDTVCAELAISVTDPVNAPLGPFSPLNLNPLDSLGNEITDLSGQMKFYLRVRSADTVRIGLQLRSADGSVPFRSNTIQKTVFPDLQSWTLLEYTFNSATIGGFDSTDFRDLWLFLDPGSDNFPGNDLRLDFVAIGAVPDMNRWSPCLALPPFSFPFVLNWADTSETKFTGNAAAPLLNQTIDTLCEELRVSVIDPVNAPLGPFSPLFVNPIDNQGSDLTDLSGQMQFFVRVRSADTVKVGLQLRSGDGSPAARSDVIEKTVFPDLQNWTLLSYVFDGNNIGGFDSTDLRDLWLFLDRGQDNFQGNDVYFDFVSVGEKPDPSSWSPCLVPPPFPFPYVVNWSDTADVKFVGSASAPFLTQTIDTVCEELTISVSDPVNAPLGPFSPLNHNPQDSLGNELTDLSGQMRFFVRVRSLDTLRLGMQLRSGDGSVAFRTDVIEDTVMPGLEDWTLLAYQFEPSNLSGFDSTDFRDLWLFLDRGEDNFQGNEVHLDFVSIGSLPDSSTWSLCPLPSNEVSYILNWNTASDPDLGGTGSAALTQSQDLACGELILSVSDPVGNPLGKLDPLEINPLDSLGNDITDLSHHLRFYLRVRSKEAFPLGLQLRSGDGSASSRSAIIEQIVPANLAYWTLLEYTFSPADLGGFDSTDLRDVWLFADPNQDNFAGNEFHLDFFSIGELPDSSTWSTCVEPVPFAFPYLLNWENPGVPVLTGIASGVLEQVIDVACEELQISVADTLNDPLNPFNPLFINPMQDDTTELVDLSGQMVFYLRVRGADSVGISMQLRSGDGSVGSRTEPIEQFTNGDLNTWQILEYRFEGADLGGFDSTDLRDLWLYLDRKETNFRGNDLRIDFLSIGDLPPKSSWSPCIPPPPSFPYALNWNNGLDPLPASQASNELNFVRDILCSELQVSVADPDTAPMDAVTPLVFNPLDTEGNEIRDFSNQMRFYLRVRSRDTLRLTMQLRSRDGSPSFRTQRIEQVLNGGQAEWSLLEFQFDSASLASFDSTDVRDIWLFLDRGTENFRGNDFRLDFLAVGSLPDSSTWSQCFDTDFRFPFVAQWKSETDGQFWGEAEATVNQTVDANCEEIGLVVSDPSGNPWPASVPLTYYPRDPFGNYYRDLTNQTSVYLRVRSYQPVTLSLRLESHSGGRTQVINQSVPGNLDDWSVLSFVWGPASLNSFDPADFQKILLYLDQGQDNFAGNDFHIDYLAIGGEPADSTNAPCYRTDILSWETLPFRLYPNPIARGEQLQLEVEAAKPGKWELKVWNTLGQLMRQETVPVSAGPNRMNVPVALEPGFYWVELNNGSQRAVQKVWVR